MLVVNYPLFEQTRLLIQKHGGQTLDEDFGADVTITVQFIAENLSPFNLELSELSRGSIQAEIIESNPETIMPLEVKN